MRAFCPPKNTPEKDIVMTPEWLAIEIIYHFSPSGIILDPIEGPHKRVHETQNVA